MKFLYTFFVLVMFIVSISFPQTEENTAAEVQNEEQAAATAMQPQNMDDPCDWGVLFSWKPNFDIGKYYIGRISSQTTEGSPNNFSVTGIGAEKYLSNKASLYGGLSVGIGGSSWENETNTQETSSTEFGVKIGYNYYFKGVEASISPFIGPWVSAAFYSESTTNTFNEVENKDEFSASSFGIGVSGGAYVQLSEDLNLDFGAKYNLGFMINPSSTETRQEVESDGPSSWSFGDCGGQLLLRMSF